jgi:FkbM family methyltransferase
MGVASYIRKKTKATASKAIGWASSFIECVPIVAGASKGLRVPISVVQQYPLIIFGLYEKGVVKAFQSCGKDNKVVYDIGAHVGISTLLLAGTFRAARVFAFEPYPSNIKSLQKVQSANPTLNLSVIEAAVSDKDGTARFLESGSSFTGRLAINDEGHSPDGGRSFDCQSLTLDNFVAAGHPAPDLIKLDVEAAEALVITGAKNMINRYSPKMIIELHGPKPASEVWDTLSSLNYEIKIINESDGELIEIEGKSQLLGRFGPGDLWTHHILASRADAES